MFNTQTLQGLAGKQSALLVAGNQLSTTEVGIGQQDGLVTILSYALASKWGQMAYLCGDELRLFRDTAWNTRLSSQWFLYETINYVIGKGGKFLAHQPSGAKVVEVDRYSDLMKAKLV